jgi:serine/threonine protein kinase
MAEVFRAVAHGVERFSRVFVVKRIQREHAATPELVEMFANEARISALLNHPNIVQVYDFGQLDGSYFISMEYLRGKDLLAVLRQLRAAGRLMPPALAAFIAREVAAGLAYAHQLVAQGGKSLEIIHRDVSPSNVMLLRAGGVKLLDFGIAKASAALQDGGHTTATGMVKGKLSYLSPEQVKHEAVDVRTDIFSLGVVLWECLTGKRLFHDRSDYHTMNNVLTRTVPPPSSQQMGVPEDLDAIVLKMLERDRDQRTTSAKTVVDELDQFLVAHPLRPRMLPRLLDELFGPDGHELESVPVAGPRHGDDETPVMTAVMLPTIPSVTAITAVAGGSISRSDALLPTSSSGGLPKAAKPPARVWPWAAGAVLVVAAFAAGRLVQPPSAAAPEDGAETSAFTRAIVAIPRSDAPRGTVTPVPTEAPVAGTQGAPAAADQANRGAAAKVIVRVESDPSGAEVAGPSGVLGTTPLTLNLPRAAQPIAITVTKAGFEPSRQNITPERDTNALVSLRALPGGARKTETPSGNAGGNVEGAKVETASVRPNGGRRAKPEKRAADAVDTTGTTDATKSAAPTSAGEATPLVESDGASTEEAPAAEAANTEATKTEAPKTEAAKADSQKAEFPKAETKPGEPTPPAPAPGDEANAEKPTVAPAP